MHPHRPSVRGWFSVFLGIEFVPLSCMFVLWQAGGSTGLLMDLAANEKAVHPDFFNGKQSFHIDYIQLALSYRLHRFSKSPLYLKLL